MHKCICGREFTQRQNCNRHKLECDMYMASAHTCKCGKTFLNADELNAHQNECKSIVKMECQLTQLVNNNPVSVIPNEHYGMLVSKIKEKFNDNEQQQFIQSFYCYLKYHQRNDFIVSLDDVWQWLGFSTKQKAKDLIIKNFKQDNDYKILLNQLVSQHGGHNKEIIMMSVHTFKRVCMKAGTAKSASIHEYYIKLEEVLQDTLHDALTTMQKQIQTTSEDMREKTILEQFPENVQCVYYGSIDNLSNTGERLIKFGNSNNLKERVDAHRKTYSNFKLINAFKVYNKLHMENAMKEHEEFIKRRRDLVIHGQNRVELLSIQNTTYEDIDKLIKYIISCSECTPENLKRLVEENKNLSNKLAFSQEEVTRLRIENLQVLRKYNAAKRRTKQKEEDVISSVNELENVLTPEPNLLAEPELVPEPVQGANTPNPIVLQFDPVIIVQKKPMRAKDGYYYIDGGKFKECFGTREDVMAGTAYKTTGGLTKNKLMINKYGKVVSALKFLQEKDYNRFKKCGVNK